MAEHSFELHLLCPSDVDLHNSVLPEDHRCWKHADYLFEFKQWQF